MSRRSASGEERGIETERLGTSHFDPDFFLIASIRREKGKLYIPKELADKYQPTGLFPEDLQILSCKRPGFHLYKKSLFYVTPKTLKIFTVVPRYLSLTTVAESGDIVKEEDNRPVKFYPLNYAELYSQLFN